MKIFLRLVAEMTLVVVSFIFALCIAMFSLFAYTPVVQSAHGPRSINAPAGIVPSRPAPNPLRLSSPRPEPRYSLEPVVDGLSSPDGLAIDPFTRDLYVSEESANRVRRISSTRSAVVVDQDTPILDGRGKASGVPLRSPEGVAVCEDGTLLVVEDLPGGRLLAFPNEGSKVFHRGYAVPLPGTWSDMAWEDVDVLPDGRLLLVGSSAEAALSDQAFPVPRAVLLYRDIEGAWWVPCEQLFASFSSACFSRDGRYAVYVCELTGAVGWVDLTTRDLQQGVSKHLLKSPEGVTLLRNGDILVAEEGGRLVSIDPATDERHTVCDDTGALESVLWDEAGDRVLVTADQSGQVLALVSDPPWPARSDRLQTDHGPVAQRAWGLPENCPPHLARLLALGGVEPEAIDSPGAFQKQVERLPLIFVNARATLLQADRPVADPIEHVAFLILNPNQLTTQTGVFSAPVSGFAAVLRSSEVIGTTMMPVKAWHGRLLDGFTSPMKSWSLAVPFPAAVQVSVRGIVTVHFLGLGRTPDYALLLNLLDRSESYLVVQELDGAITQYRIEEPPEDNPNKWVVALEQKQPESWARMSDTAPTDLGLGLAEVFAMVAPGERGR